MVDWWVDGKVVGPWQGGRLVGKWLVDRWVSGWQMGGQVAGRVDVFVECIMGECGMHHG